jgi:hypothetical protein
MADLVTKYDLSPRDLSRGRNLKLAAWSAPVALSVPPAAVFFTLMMIFGTTPPAAATFLFLGLILTAVGFVAGLGLSGFFAYRYSNWSKEMREKIAADGIKAEEIDWFKNELRPAEKRALKELKRTDLMLADAYRETLASRLTATRIVRSSRKELQSTQRRKAKLKNLKSDNAEKFLAELGKDEKNIGSINEEAKVMLAEAESRLQMIEAAAARGSHLADSELALKKLSARAAELPLALEEAKLAQEIREELENEPQV